MAAIRMADDLASRRTPRVVCNRTKARSKQKIDGMVALIIVLSRVIVGPGMGSVYNARAKAGGEARLFRSPA
jgi:hypothetical protein